MRFMLIPLNEHLSRIMITNEISLVGRKEDCDIQIDDKSVSKMHCILVKSHDVLLLRDLGSTNGTRINGIRVRRATLLPNDLIQFANARFKFQILSEDHVGNPDKNKAKLEVTLANDADLHSMGIKQKLVKPIKNQGESKEIVSIDKEKEEIDATGDLSEFSVQMNSLPDVYRE